MKKTIKLITSIKTTIILVSLILVTVFANTNFDADNQNTDFFTHTTNTVNISQMPLRYKITQMFIVNHIDSLKDYYKENKFGGVYVVKPDEKEKFLEISSFYNCNDCIHTFITVDLEGRYSNPFSKFKEFACASDIMSSDEAYILGDEQGKLLKELGIDVTYTPVLDLEDNIWHCRNFENFKQNPEELTKVAISYLEGLHNHDIIAVAKHYPGKTLEAEDLHKGLLYVNLSEQDIIPFIKIKNYADGIMITHTISSGRINSYNKPCTISEQVIDDLNHNGLIVTDDIGMEGLKSYYTNNDIPIDELYIDVINAGNDLIIFFELDINKIEHIIDVIEQAVKNNKIDVKTINKSVVKILNEKGIKVVE